MAKPRSLEAETRLLLKKIVDQGVYEPNVECSNEVCQILGRMQQLVRPRRTAAHNGNGHHPAKS